MPPGADNAYVPEDITPADETGPGQLRASDADRDRVLGQLQDALASGMIDLDEFEAIRSSIEDHRKNPPRPPGTRTS